jgi:hypothetical protein
MSVGSSSIGVDEWTMVFAMEIGLVLWNQRMGWMFWWRRGRLW